MVSQTKIIVRYVETDQMGVAHHSNYYSWFEVGRTEFFKQIGIPYSDVEKMGFYLPLVESSCSYKIGAKYEDELIIETSITYFNGIKVVLEYKVIRENDDKILAIGKTSHAFTDRTFKPINLKKVNQDLYNKISNYIN